MGAVTMPEGVSSDPMPTAAISTASAVAGRRPGPADGQGVPHRPSGRPNEPMLLGCLATRELAIKTAGVPFAPGGVNTVMKSLAN